jgi:hypothetical protein
VKTGPRCDTLFEKWRPEAVAHIEEHGPFTPETLLLWAFREGFKVRGERDRKASQPDASAKPDICGCDGTAHSHDHQ